MSQKSLCLKFQNFTGLDIHFCLCKNGFHFKYTSTLIFRSCIWTSCICDICASVSPYYALNDDELLLFLSDSPKQRFICDDSMLFNPSEFNRDDDACHYTDFDPGMYFFVMTAGLIPVITTMTSDLNV